MHINFGTSKKEATNAVQTAMTPRDLQGLKMQTKFVPNKILGAENNDPRRKNKCQNCLDLNKFHKYISIFNIFFDCVDFTSVVQNANMCREFKQ